MLQNLYLTGDLAGLLLAFLDKHSLAMPELVTRLHTYDKNQRMTYQQWWQILGDLEEATGDPQVGLKVGACAAPEHFGVVGYLCQSCDTLLEAAMNFERYQRLLYGGPPAALKSHDNTLRIEWQSPHDEPNAHSDEALISALLHVGQSLTGNQELAATRIGFMHKPLCDTGLYEAWFGCPVQFQCPVLFVEGPASLLLQPIRRADPSLKKLLSDQAKGLLDQTVQDDGFQSEFQKALLKGMRFGKPNQEYVASLLNMSTRTLHRRLQEQGAQFKDVLKATRLQLAKDYLQKNQLTLSEIALLLGYSEQSAFSRAFAAWTGTTPLKYQKTVKEANNRQGWGSPGDC